MKQEPATDPQTPHETVSAATLERYRAYLRLLARLQLG